MLIGIHNKGSDESMNEDGERNGWWWSVHVYTEAGDARTSMDRALPEAQYQRPSI